MTHWLTFTAHIAKLATHFIFYFVYLQLFRFLLIFIYSEKMSPNSTSYDIYTAIVHGARFDISVSTYLIAIPVLLSFYSLFTGKLDSFIDKLCHKIFASATCLLTIVFIISIGYFKEYNDQFNHFMFLALYDDQWAVIKTAVKDFYLIESIILWIVVSYVIIKWQKTFNPLHLIKACFVKIKSAKIQPVVALFILGLFVCGLRGSFQKRPITRKWASISSDAFLNKTIMNPIISFKYALSDFNSLNNIKENSYFKTIDKYSAIKRFFNDSVTHERYSNYALKVKTSPQKSSPDHVFMVIMESYDSWPLQDKYASLNISNELKSLKSRGLSFSNFLPASSTTMNSFSTLLAGLPYSGINISKRYMLNSPFPTSLAQTMKNLGYEVNFYYGGFLSWQNIGEFSTHSGVDNVYGAPSIKPNSTSSKGVWGVDDEDLFDFVVKKTQSGKKSFNIILTTSYHAPYNMDLEQHGFHLKEIPNDISPIYDGRVSINRLGHLWYSDKQLGAFVKNIESQYKNSLFAITGDHFGRTFLNEHPSLSESSVVPFVIYGNSIPENTTIETPGSHIDMVPTLIDIIAPKDFKFHTLGKNLFDASDIGIGFEKLITNTMLLEFKKGKDRKVEYKGINQMNETEILDLIERHNFEKGIAREIILNGDIIQK